MDRFDPRARARTRAIAALLSLLASIGLTLAPIVASCPTASKVNGIACGALAGSLALLGIYSAWAWRALRSWAFGLCVAALLMPRGLAPWSYDLFAISIFAASFVAG